MNIFKMFLFSFFIISLKAHAVDIRVDYGERPNQAKAIVLWLHGCLQNGPDFLSFTKIDQLAQKEDLVIIYPSQKKRNNPFRCWNWFKPSSLYRNNNVFKKFIKQIEDIKKEYNLHHVPVLVGGFSAGGVLTTHLALCYPDVFSGALIHSGGPYNLMSKLAGRRKTIKNCEVDFIKNTHEKVLKKVLIVHGTKDKIAPFSLSTMVRNQLEYLKEHSQYEFEIESLIINGMKHKWSGGIEGDRLSYPAGPNVTNQFIENFL